MVNASAEWTHTPKNGLLIEETASLPVLSKVTWRSVGELSIIIS